MIKLFTQIKAIVDQATQLWEESRDGKGKEGWIVFFEARSFWLAIIAVVFAGFATFGVPLPFAEEVVVEVVTQGISGVLALWAIIERIRGKKTVVWSAEQANQAIKQAQAATQLNVAKKVSGDKLVNALNKAISKG